MKQNTATGEAESQVDKKLLLNFTSLAKLPLWFIAGFALLPASSVPSIYFFLKALESKSRLENFSGTQLFESRQARGKWD